MGRLAEKLPVAGEECDRCGAPAEHLTRHGPRKQKLAWCVHCFRANRKALDRVGSITGPRR